MILSLTIVWSDKNWRERKPLPSVCSPLQSAAPQSVLTLLLRASDCNSTIPLLPLALLEIGGRGEGSCHGSKSLFFTHLVLEFHGCIFLWNSSMFGFGDKSIFHLHTWLWWRYDKRVLWPVTPHLEVGEHTYWWSCSTAIYGVLHVYVICISHLSWWTSPFKA